MKAVTKGAWGCGVVLLLASGVWVKAQQGTPARDPFNGTWSLNVEKTKQLSGGPSPVYEVITFAIGDDNVQHYQVEIQTRADGPRTKGWYDSKYNDLTFVPYQGETGKGTELITVKVDERTHYRIARTVDGKARYVMMRRLSDDGKSYIVTGLDTDGKPGQWRWMDKIK